MARKLKKPVRNALKGIAAAAAIITLLLLFKMLYGFIRELVIILEHNDREELMMFISEKPAWSGLFTLYVMSVLQVVSVILPGMLIQVSGALIFGWWKAFLICWAGFVSGNALIFIAARIMKRSVTEAFRIEAKNGWLIKEMNRRDPAFVTAFACMIPGIPNGIIPYIASRTRLYLHQFVTAVASSCWIQILLNCIAGHFLVRGKYGFTIFAFALQIVLLAVMTRYRDPLFDFLSRMTEKFNKHTA